MEDTKPLIRFCVVCCYSFTPSTPFPITQPSLSQLCVRLNRLFPRDKSNPLIEQLVEENHVAICGDCFQSINSTVDVMNQTEQLQSHVYELQKQVVVELKRLQNSFDIFEGELRKVKETVINSDGNCLEHMGLLTSDKQSVDWLRKSLLEVGSQTESFRTTLVSKFDVVAAVAFQQKRKQTKRTRQSKKQLSHTIEDVVIKPDISGSFDISIEEEMETTRDAAYSTDNNDDDYRPDNLSEDEPDKKDEPWEKKKSEKPKRKRKKKKPNTNHKRAWNEFKLTKLTTEEYEETIAPYKTLLSTVSKVKKNLLKSSLRRMKIQQKLLAGGAPNVSTNPDDDEFWYRKQYSIEFQSESQMITIGGKGFSLDDDNGQIQCSQCPFTVEYPPDRENFKYETLRVKERQIYQHLLGYHLKAYVCSNCNKDCKTERSYRLHVKIHKDNAITCDICGKPLTSKETMKFHKVTHMNEEEKRVAMETDHSIQVRFTKTDSPKRHMCPTCGKEFKTSKDCRVHQMTHEEVRDTVVCPICGKTMLRRSYELYHMRYACPGREIARVPCSHCDMTFKNGRFLKLHYDRVHSQDAINRVFQCDQCGKDFGSKLNLKVHKELHNDSLDYKCGGCGKQFSVRRYWKRHEVVCLAGGGSKRKSGGESSSSHSLWGSIPLGLN